MWRGLIITALIGILGACAHSPSETVEIGPNGEGLPAPAPGSVKEKSSFRLSDPEPPKVADEELDGIPVEINQKVEQWISYFQGRGRPHMERYLSRSSRYSTLMKRILRENGLPEDLIYIALIESGFNQKATSRAAAVGYWQFIRGTGKRYGLEINALVDERRDPVLSTQAAAEYYKGLYSIFGSWYLAMASYNVGENRVKREIVKHKTYDFWELVRKRRLPKETMNYVPKFIAAKLIGNNPEKYGFTEVDYEKPIEFELIRVENPVNLRVMAEKMGMDYEEFKQINAKFRGEIAPTKTNGVLELRVPLGQTEVAMTAAQASVVSQVEFIADAGETQTYRVRRGDSLYTIARKYKTNVAWLREVNDIGGGRRLKIGQRLQVPDRTRRPTPEKRTIVAKKDIVKPPVVAATPAPTSVVGAQAATEKTTEITAEVAAKEVEKKEDVEQAAQTTEIVTDKGVYYVVQPGDSLYTIAQEYDSTVKELQKMNKIRRGRVLKIGAKILVPKDDRLPEEPGGETKRDEKAQQQDDAEPTSGTGAEVGPESSIQKSPANLPAAERSKDQAFTRTRKTARLPADSTPELARSARVHVVKKGDNLFRIALKYGVSMKAIQAQNGLRGASELSAGKRLVIPE